jgi:hypothetical protein
MDNTNCKDGLRAFNILYNGAGPSKKVASPIGQAAIWLGGNGFG